MPQEYKSKSTKQQIEDVDNDQINSVSVDDFDVNKLRIPPIDDKRSSDTHYHSFPVYEYDNGKEDKLILTTGEIEITKGGIPRLDEKWRKSDAKREFMWLGIDEAQPECKKLFDALRSIDNHFDGLISFDSDGKKDNNIESQTVYTTKDKKKKDPLTNLEYSPLVKLSVQGGDGTQKEDQPEYVPYERVKLRFSKKYDKDRVEGEPSELTTLLFVGEKENEEDCKYPSDFEKFLRWKCTARFVLQFSKFRTKKVAEKDKKGKSLQRDCAFDINMLHVYITKEAPNAGISNADKYRKRFFPPTMKSTKSQDVEEKQKAKNDESSEESSNDENEKQPVKSTKEKDTKQKPKSKQESESESESEEEEIPAKKTNAKTNKAPVKNTKKVNSDSEDSSEESDSEDDKSEEEKPKSKKSSR
jgi:hypothetical protein